MTLQVLTQNMSKVNQAAQLSGMQSSSLYLDMYARFYVAISLDIKNEYAILPAVLWANRMLQL